MSQIEIADTPTKIAGSSTGLHATSLRLKNKSGASIYLGADNAVTADDGETTSGYEFEDGEVLTFDLAPSGSLYGIVAADTARLDVL